GGEGGLVVGACACDGGGSPRSGAALVFGAGGACWPCGFARGGRAPPERSAVGGAQAGRDRAAGAPGPADLGRAAAVTVSGGGAVSLPFLCARSRRLYGA